MHATPALPPDRHGRRRLRAVRVSAAIAATIRALGGAGTVVSVHRNVINVRIDGWLVAIASEAAGDLPNGVTVAEAPDFATIGVRPGDPVHRSRIALRLGDRVIVDLVAPVWDPRLRSRRAREVGARAAALEQALAGIEDSAGDRSTFGIPIVDALGALERALRAQDLTAARAAGRRLIGLGPGLTPSGDDILVGLDAMLTSIGHPLTGQLASDWAGTAAGATTDVAAAFHRHAAVGEFSARLHDLCDALLDGPVAGIPAATHRAAAWGATSGRDTLVGAALGMRIARVTATDARAA